MSGLVASYDLIPDFMNRNMSYDPMVVLWHSTQQISYYVQPALPTAQLIYTGSIDVILLAATPKVIESLGMILCVSANKEMSK